MVVSTEQTVADETVHEDVDASQLLQELLDISNRSAISRFSKKPATNANTVSKSSIGRNCADENGADENGTTDDAQLFLQETPEDSSLNQYWYSKSTMTVLCDAIIEALSTYEKKKVAFLSTPSLYFAIPIDIRKSCTLFEYDTNWATDAGFQQYDFNKPLQIEESIQHTFDMVVIDPPFITSDCWEKYRETVDLLLKDKKEGLVLATTITENEKMMRSFFDAKPNLFRPDIPNLVYRYKVYTNFESKALSTESV